MALLESCTGLSKSFGSRVLFSGIALGISEGEQLPPIAKLLPKITPIPMEPRRFGASGQWDDEGRSFEIKSTSWVSLVADLLGGTPSKHAAADDNAGQDQPNALGPFRLAFLEMLFRVADGRASARPGKGRNR